MWECFELVKCSVVPVQRTTLPCPNLCVRVVAQGEHHRSCYCSQFLTDERGCSSTVWAVRQSGSSPLPVGLRVWVTSGERLMSKALGLTAVPPSGSRAAGSRCVPLALAELERRWLCTATWQRLLPHWLVDRAVCVSPSLSPPGTIRLPSSGQWFVLFYTSTDNLLSVNMWFCLKGALQATLWGTPTKEW